MARRKTYKKKSTAKHARKKGQSVYKVKGGYRISKRRGQVRAVVVVMLLLLSIGLFALLPGCTEPQRAAVDRVAAKTQEVAGAVGTAVSSGAGAVIPEPYRGGAVILAGLLGTAATGWQALRKKAYRTALVDVVVGNERFKKAEASNVAEFKRVQDAIQSPATRKVVKQIRDRGY